MEGEGKKHPTFPYLFFTKEVIKKGDVSTTTNLAVQDFTLQILCDLLLPFVTIRKELLLII